MNDRESELFGALPTSPPLTNSPEFILDDLGDLSTTGQAVKSGNSGRIVLALVAIALVAAGGFAVRAALSPPTGPASSDEAITQFFAALDNDDLVGLAELVHPAERESIAEPVFEMIEHARRLEVIAADGTDPEAVTFTDTVVEGLTYTLEKTGPRLHYVVTTGGTVTTPNEASFPAGPLFDRFDIDPPTGDGGTSTVDLGEEPVRIAVVEDNGSWYVSLWYSVAEEVRRNERAPFSELGSGPAPVGADSPDAVMEDMARAISELNPEGVLTLLDPREAAVLYDYSSLFLDELDDAMDEARSEADSAGVSWTLDAIDFDATEVNGRQVVSASMIAMTFEYEVDGSSEEATMTIQDGCTVITVDSETTDSCASSSDDQSEPADDTLEQLGQILDLSEVTLNAFEKLGDVETGLTVVERDGRWYLSLMPTALETVNDHLAVLEPEDLVAIGVDIEEIVDDADRILPEVFELWIGALEGEQAGASALSELAETLAGDSGGAFVDVAPAIGSDDDYEPFVEPDMGPLAEVLPNPESWYGMDLDFSYLSWEMWELDSEGFVAGAYSFGDSYIEVLLFDSPVDPNQLDPNLWSLEELDGVTRATNSETETAFTFVGNYVVWNDSGPEAQTSAAALIEWLR